MTENTETASADDRAEGQPSTEPTVETPRPAPEPAPTEVRSDRVAVEIDYDRHVAFALQQSAVPLVKGLRVRNLGETPLEDLRLVLWAEPDLSPEDRAYVKGLQDGLALVRLHRSQKQDPSCRQLDPVGSPDEKPMKNIHEMSSDELLGMDLQGFPEEIFASVLHAQRSFY